MTELTARAVAYCLSEEAIVQEAYLDSENKWTWAGGVTDASGHYVERYRDNPQPLERCLEVTVWLMRQKYLPPVLRAFSGYALAEHQLAAALSFHWNTGAIGTTQWVRDVKAGRRTMARAFLENHYLNHGDLKARRLREAALFFERKWPGDIRVPVYPVRKPGYRPDFARGRRSDMTALIEKALAA
ncbi:glycoside hydrolase family protein [Novosphingobium beihaiensis]|uniref:Lysozyme n=1 Tax=Novosphingobium beihaiensis TaxID=2930389 RepID=A0ABT0BWG9_9SPHN|nr:hypothetical protein [Novosphingobium beihaiensis]MCJ2189166.1 hypothetical protein [Novosphingobium beihaiensis]